MSTGATTIRLGFIPLIDAAIPIVAADMGFAAARGLDLVLQRETSWANVRDRLAIGHFEAAHLLAPMPVAAALGLTPLDARLVAPLALGLGGNAITVSEAVWQEMQAAKPDLVANDPASMGAALKAALSARGGARRLAFAVVHPYSAHNYELRYWLAASGIHPERDIDLPILPPPLMPDALASGSIDGFCVGEPWNSNAARRVGGRIILTKSAIWRAGPEKVLGLRADWAERNPEETAALIEAMLDAALWCSSPANAEALVEILARPERLNLPAEDIAAPLQGQMLLADGAQHRLQDFMVFGGGTTNLPLKGHALWFYSQMLRWNQAKPTEDAPARVADCFRDDLAGASLLRRDPAAAATLAAVKDQPIGGFFDGIAFNPATLEAYLAAQGRLDRE